MLNSLSERGDYVRDTVTNRALEGHQTPRRPSVLRVADSLTCRACSVSLVGLSEMMEPVRSASRQPSISGGSPQPSSSTTISWSLNVCASTETDNGCSVVRRIEGDGDSPSRRLPGKHRHRRRRYRRQAPAKKKFRIFSKGVRPEYDPCQGTSHALQIPMSCGQLRDQGSAKVHHLLAVPYRVG